MSTLGNILTKEHHMTCHALILLKTWHYISGLLTYLLTYITEYHTNKYVIIMQFYATVIVRLSHAGMYQNNYN